MAGRRPSRPLQGAVTPLTLKAPSIPWDSASCVHLSQHLADRRPHLYASCWSLHALESVLAVAITTGLSQAAGPTEPPRIATHTKNHSRSLNTQFQSGSNAHAYTTISASTGCATTDFGCAAGLYAAACLSRYSTTLAASLLMSVWLAILTAIATASAGVKEGPLCQRTSPPQGVRCVPGSDSSCDDWRTLHEGCSCCEILSNQKPKEACL